MIDGEITCIYDCNSVHHVLSVGGDFDRNDNLSYDLAELICRVLEDSRCSPEIVVEQIKVHFDRYFREEESNG